MNSISGTKKSLTTRLNENMGKILLSTLLLVVIIIGVTFVVVDGMPKAASETKTETKRPLGSSTLASEPTAEPEPTTTSEPYNPVLVPLPLRNESDINIRNGTVVVDKDQIRISIEDDNYDDILLAQLEKTTKYWYDQAQMTLKDRLYKKPNTNVAKNIIYFLGDGMSLTTLTATRIFQGQLLGRRGEESDLWFQKFPTAGLAKTYCLDYQVADSACSATAYLTGVKANLFTQGVNGKVAMGDCEASLDRQNHVYSLLRWAQLSGKSSGIVTNTRVTHATPGAAYAHNSNRLYECDHDVRILGGDPNVCIDIARQLIESETGKELNVIMGGGAQKLLPNTTLDAYGSQGERDDGRNLIDEWIADKSKQGNNWAYVTNRTSLLNVDHSNVKNLLGIFASQHMAYHADADHNLEPTLVEMTEMAMNVLSSNQNGYVLFVEGGLIDYANHATMAQKAVIETLVFSEAVKMADQRTNETDTMILVTSDHSHTMTLSGYPYRGQNVLGTMKTLNEGVDPLIKDRFDNKSVTSISYAYGPGYFMNHDEQGNRIDLDQITIDKDYQYITSVGANNEAHGGDDVGIFARGPFSHLLTGVVQQNYIPHVCAYAACLGVNGAPNRCNE